MTLTESEKEILHLSESFEQCLEGLVEAGIIDPDTALDWKDYVDTEQVERLLDTAIEDY